MQFSLNHQNYQKGARMSSELSEEFVAEECCDDEFAEPDLPIWDEDGKIHLTRTTKKGG